MLDASTTSSVAVFSAEAYGIQQKGLPDLPVTWDLAPGETGLVVLRIGSAVAYEGELSTSVVHSGVATDVDIALQQIDSLAAPALVDLGERYLRAGSTLECWDERSSDSTCTATDLLAAAG